MTDKIQPNGKALLNTALPGGEGGHVLALREDHEHGGHIRYLSQHMAELKSDHNLGTLGLEQASYTMLFHWAYQDALAHGSPEAIKTARDMLVDAYEAYGDPKNISRQRGVLVAAAIEQGIDVVCYDARFTLAKDYQKSAESRGEFVQSGRAQRAFSDLDDNDKYYSMLRDAHKLYHDHPEYKARLDAIEGGVQKMQDAHVRMDIILANVVSSLADPSKNMLTIGGSAHQSGEKDPEQQVDGIFDEGLAYAPLSNHSHWKVTDCFAGTFSGLKNIAQDITQGDAALRKPRSHRRSLGDGYGCGGAAVGERDGAGIVERAGFARPVADV